MSRLVVFVLHILSFVHTKIIAMPWHGQLYVAGKIDGKWILAIGGRLVLNKQVGDGKLKPLPHPINIVELCNINRSSSLFKFIYIIVFNL